MSYHVLRGTGETTTQPPLSALVMPLFMLGTLALFGYVFREEVFGKKARPARAYARNARWSYRQKKSLPDSAFLYVAPDGTRKLPYRKPSGEIDLPHLRNALARIGRSNIPEREKAALETKARKILALATGRPYSKLEARAAKGKARRRREQRKAA